MAALGVAGDGQAEDGVEEREGQARHRAQLPVEEAELLLDRLGEDVDHLPIHEIHDVDDEQKAHRVAAIAVGHRTHCRYGRRGLAHDVGHVSSVGSSPWSCWRRP
jgi:hypothetical protein